MPKIERLTEEQIAKFPEYVRQWTAYGTCTDPADRPLAEAAIMEIYHGAGKKSPRVIWCDSPLSMVLTKSIVEKLPTSVGASVWASVKASVRDSVGASVRASVGASVYGQHEAAWLSFYAFFRDECGLTGSTEKLIGLFDLCQSCGWILPFENVCFASDRHDVCRLDARGVIHAEDGPAIHYRDGFAVYAWHGVRVPAHWIEDRAKLDPTEVLRAENVEQRAAGAAIIGWGRMASALDMRVIDGDPQTDIGALVELKMPGLTEPGRFLMAQCPRNGTICEGVPRVSDIDNLPITTAIAAQAWRDCLPASEYTHPEIRT